MHEKMKKTFWETIQKLHVANLEREKLIFLVTWTTTWAGLPNMEV
jgi:hypothetical protein